MTTKAQIQTMQDICKKLETDPLIEWAKVNDWGRHGNFSLLVSPNRKGRGITSAVRARLQRCLSGTGAHIRQLIAPEPRYAFDSYTRRRVLRGYQHDYWIIDVDYETYYSEINLFHSQLEGSSRTLK